MNEVLILLLLSILIPLTVLLLSTESKTVGP